MKYRKLKFNEIDQIWDIDRTEYVDSIYQLENKKLKEKKIDRTFYGWPPNEDKKYGPILKKCYKRKGFFFGGFVDSKLKAIVVLDSKWIGKNKDTLQLKFLHVDKKYRKRGIGKLLFQKAVEQAQKLKAKRIYVSSTENKNTVEFYKLMGCKITDDIDESLYKLEPNDIHMDLQIVRK